MSCEIVDTSIDYIKIDYHSNWIGLYIIKLSASCKNKESLYSKYSTNDKPKDMNLLEDNIKSFIIYNSNLIPKHYLSVSLFYFLAIIESLFSYSKWMTNGSYLLDQILDQFNKLPTNTDTSLGSAVNLMVQNSNKK